MRRLLCISLCACLGLAFVGCKSSEKGKKSPDGSATTETGEAVAADSLSIMISDTAKTIKQLPDSSRTPASDHNAPNQEELDSLKQAKTKAKQKLDTD